MSEPKTPQHPAAKAEPHGPRSSISDRVWAVRNTDWDAVRGFWPEGYSPPASERTRIRRRGFQRGWQRPKPWFYSFPGAVTSSVMCVICGRVLRKGERYMMLDEGTLGVCSGRVHDPDSRDPRDWCPGPSQEWIGREGVAGEGRAVASAQSRPAIPLRTKLAVFKRDGYRCLACGNDDPLVLAIDHIKAVSRGGKNEIANYQTLCKRCNSSKGTRTINYRAPTSPNSTDG